MDYRIKKEKKDYYPFVGLQRDYCIISFKAH